MPSMHVDSRPESRISPRQLRVQLARSLAPNVPRTGRIVSCAVGGLLLAYIIVIARSPAVGLGDTSNHLVRAYIMADLIFHGGARFGSQFHYHFLAVPYVLPDLLVAAAIEVLGPRVAVAAWTVVTFLSVPAALLLYFRVVVGIESKELLESEGVPFLLLCAAYLSTDFFFVSGFFAFKLGLACAIAILALIELLRRRWSGGLFALYGACLVAAYLIHLTTPVFIAAILGVSAIVRLWFHSLSLRRELLLIAPIIAILAWHLAVAVHYGPPTDLASAFRTWGTLRGKAAGLAENYRRYGGRVDSLLLYLYVASLVVLIRTRHWRSALASPRVIESLAVAATFFVVYLILPFALGDATYVDIRALAPAALFVLLACLHLPRAESSPSGSGSSPWLAVVLAIVLSAVNLAYLGRHFEELSGWSTKVRSLFANIPRAAHVLPVQTLAAVWHHIDPSAIMTIDRGALTPYLFSADTGAPQVYFHYIDRGYAPADDWYIRQSSSSVKWRQLACTYQYILMMRPFDPLRIRIATKGVAETSSAELLAIDPRSC